mgnify:CR=1 FL=1
MTIERVTENLQAAVKGIDAVKNSVARITANGLSSSQPVTFDDGKIDSKLSRRVDFRIRTKADEKMNELAKGINHNGKN